PVQCAGGAGAVHAVHSRPRPGRPGPGQEGGEAVMKDFTYYRPTSAEAAVALLDKSWGTAELLGGGTDLLDLQKEYIAQPSKVISVAAIKHFDGIIVQEKEPPVIAIGAGTKLITIAHDATIKEHFPALATAAGGVATPHSRHTAELGGDPCAGHRGWDFREQPGLV